MAEVMGWEDERARDEYSWLRTMTRLKYDKYGDYLSGMRFTESLVAWMRQFQPSDREIAYRFLKEKLIFISSREMQHLAELLYPEVVHRELVLAVAREMNVPSYLVLCKAESRDYLKEARRRTLFFGLSDGARIDYFRRVNSRNISNEQVVISTQPSKEKWRDLLSKLQEKYQHKKFQRAFLIDDLTASGKSLLRINKDEATGEQTVAGKLKKFWDEYQANGGAVFEDQWNLHVHHLLATETAKRNIEEANQKVKALLGDRNWFPEVKFSFGTIIPDTAAVSPNDEISKLIEAYYDPCVDSSHGKVGETENIKFGFNANALSVVLEHNTPNNSIALLWAESPEVDPDGHKHRMIPLFRRRERHTDE